MSLIVIVNSFTSSFSIIFRSQGTKFKLKASKYDTGIVNQEIHPLENKGLSQTSETDYDLNQVLF